MCELKNFLPLFIYFLNIAALILERSYFGWYHYQTTDILHYTARVV